MCKTAGLRAVKVGNFLLNNLLNDEGKGKKIVILIGRNRIE